jgi:CRISPR-associated protein Cas2
MNFKFMRVMLFFDLPTTTTKDIKSYHTFVKNIKKNGYIMNQYSIYTKLVVSPKMAQLEESFIRKYVPNNGGNVQLLTVTENQFASIVYIIGDNKSKFLTSTDKIT